MSVINYLCIVFILLCIFCTGIDLVSLQEFDVCSIVYCQSTKRKRVQLKRRSSSVHACTDSSMYMCPLTLCTYIYFANKTNDTTNIL